MQKAFVSLGVRLDLKRPQERRRRRRSRDASSRNTCYFTFPAMELTEGSLKGECQGLDSQFCEILEYAGGYSGGDRGGPLDITPSKFTSLRDGSHLWVRSSCDC